MTIVDRYLFFLFVKTFLICFLSLTGLYIVIHLFSNLDEMVELGQSDGWPKLFYEFYVPRIAELFDNTAGTLLLIAGIFSVSLLQRRREMTAIEASGITKARILRPVFLTAIVVVGLTIANRELMMPKIKSSLVRTAQTWGDQGEVDLTVQEDFASGVVLRGDRLFIADGRITAADAQMPRVISNVLPRVRSNWAILEPANEDHPAGLRFQEVLKPANLMEMSSLSSEDGHPIFFSPADNAWLQDQDCFVACEFDVEQMAYGKRLVNYQTTPEMIAALRKPRRQFGLGQQVSVHSRFLRPILDLTLLMLGLPMVIGGIERNVFVSAGACFLIVGAIQLTTAACSTLGASALIRPAALAAWIPVAVFLPLAVVAMRKLKS